jgi:hypothetical protein
VCGCMHVCITTNTNTDLYLFGFVCMYEHVRVCVCVYVCVGIKITNDIVCSGNTKVGSITVPLTSCLTSLGSAVRQLTIYVFVYKTE